MAWDLIGHSWARDFLQDQLEAGALHHAYLITGPDAVGKGTVARRLAQALLCEQGPGAPCRNCRPCQQVERLEHPDLHPLEAEWVGGTLKIEQVRDMQRQISLSPYQSDRHIVLILRAHEMSRAAANALLKTLEEPPHRVLLILTARAEEGLLPTIVSRCEILPLRPVPPGELVEGLRSRLGAERAELLGALAAGRPGFALRLAEDEDALEARRSDLADLLTMIEGDRTERFKLAAAWVPNRDRAAERERIMRALESWLSLWRDVMLAGFAADVPLSNPDHREAIRKLAEALPPRRGAAATAATVAAMNGIAANANLQLALEALLLEYPQLELN